MNVLITGASRGIGYEMVKLFAHRSCCVIALSRNAEKLEKLHHEIMTQDPLSEIVTIPFDLMELEKISCVLLSELKRHIQHLDILINNAGLLVNKSFTDITVEEATRTCIVNFLAPAKIIGATLPLLLKASNGHVINISSMGGIQGSVKFPGLAYYSSSKSALAVLTECLAEEYKNTGISFNCLGIGAVQTEMFSEAFPGHTAPVSSLEMAEYIVDFALKGGKYYNGKILPVSISTP